MSARADVSGAAPAATDAAERARVLRDAAAIGVATGAYAVSFGAVGVAAGLSVLQTCALSALMFTGGSQFALVGVVAGGGSSLAAAATAIMVGSRNALYGLRIAPLVGARGLRRLPAAHMVIDESTAMAVARDRPAPARLAFWATGLAIFACWNAGTAVGAIGGQALADPEALGLDAAAPAAFLALLAPQARRREPQAVALAAGLVALVSVPFVPVGIPVIVGALAAVAAALGGRGRR